MTELLSCPFCGGNAFTLIDGRGYWQTSCTECHCGTPRKFETHDLAEAAWNTRAALSPSHCTAGRREELAYTSTNQIAVCRCGSFPTLYGDGARPDDGYRSLWCQSCMEHVTQMMPSEREVIEHWNNLREQEHKASLTSEQSGPTAGREIIFTCKKCEANYQVEAPTNECPVCSWHTPSPPDRQQDQDEMGERLEAALKRPDASPAAALEYARRLNDLAVNCEVDNRPGDASDLRRVAEYLASETSVLPRGASAEPVAWQPIETAPKDGTAVQLYFPKRYQGKGGVSWGCFLNGEWLDSRAMRDNDASHWQPLPAPPANPT